MPFPTSDFAVENKRSWTLPNQGPLTKGQDFQQHITSKNIIGIFINSVSDGA
jgi:hypothetical protein